MIKLVENKFQYLINGGVIMIDKFSERTKLILKYYVYLLVDPIDNCVFYVGKGSGNRVFEHEKTLNNIKVIEILTNSLEVTKIIVHSGLTENEAHSLESGLINYFSYLGTNLKNLQIGHHTNGECCTAEVFERRNNLASINISDFENSALIVNLNGIGLKDIKDMDVVKKWATIIAKFESKYKLPDILVIAYHGFIRYVFRIDEYHEEIRKIGNKLKYINKIDSLSVSEESEKYMFLNISNILKPNSDKNNICIKMVLK